MAYSWFSHCEKYLKALEFEKRFMKKQKVVLMETLAWQIPLRLSTRALQLNIVQSATAVLCPLGLIALRYNTCPVEAGLGCKGDELSALHLQRFQSRLSGNWDTKSFLSGRREAWGCQFSAGTGGVPAQRLRPDRTKEQDRVSLHHQ